MKWFTDTNGNRNSVEYFGSAKKAQAALDSLTNCKNCENCSYCSRCSDCSRCSGKKGSEDITVPNIPKIEDIHQRVYEKVSAPKALEMGNWHTCQNTHCRGGWIVHLAGEPGYALERYHGTLLAAQLIYRESGAPINPCRFYDSNEDALADMKRLAEEESRGNHP